MNLYFINHNSVYTHLISSHTLTQVEKLFSACMIPKCPEKLWRLIEGLVAALTWEGCCNNRHGKVALTLPEILEPQCYWCLKIKGRH